MAERTHKASEGFVGDIKSAVHGFTGAGDAIRGGAMEALDGVFHKKDGEAQNKEIADRGLANMRETESHFGQHGHAHGSAVGAEGHLRSTPPPPLPSRDASTAAMLASSPNNTTHVGTTHGHTAGQGSHFKH